MAEIKKINKKVINKKGKKKKKNNRLRKILRIGFLLLLIFLIVTLFKFIFSLFDKGADKITLIIGANKIELKKEILIDNEKNIYLSKDDMAILYDENIYYNPTDKTLITTYNKHVAVLTMDKSTMTINDTVVSINGKLKQDKGIVYLPFTDMVDVYDFEYSYDDESKVLIIDSTNEEKKEAVVIKNAKLKEKAKAFSGKIEKLKNGTKVTVLGIEGKYTKVRTNDGNIGFVKTNKLSDVEIIRETLEYKKLSNVEVLEEYTEVNSEYGAVVNNDKNLIVIPNLFDVNEEFELKQVISLDSEKFKLYKEWASNNNVNVCATVNFNGSMNELCSSYTTRTCLINNIYTELVKNQINIVNIDFDNIDDMEGFYRFIIEMTPRYKESGIKVIVTYKDGMNKERLSNIVDSVL